MPMMPWWMMLQLSPQVAQYSGAANDESLPPAANMGDPFSSNLPPSMGGRGSYPNVNDQFPGARTSINPNSVVNNAPTGVIPTGMTPGSPNDQFPLPVWSDETIPPVDPGLEPPPKFTDVYPAGELPEDTDTSPIAGSRPSGGQGDRRDDSGQVPGVDLTLNDHINMILNNLGLPPVPTGYNPFGGLPEGFTETNPFGHGAPTFTGPGSFGPVFSGGSVFHQLPGVRGGPLAGGRGFNYEGMTNFGALPNSWATGMGLNMAAGTRIGADRRNYKNAVMALMAANSARMAGSADHIAGGGGSGHNIANPSTA